MKVLVIDNPDSVLAPVQLINTLASGEHTAHPLNIEAVGITQASDIQPKLKDADLVFLNIEFEDQDGLSTIQYIRENAKADIQVQVFTNNHEPEILEGIFKAGADGYVQHPMVEPEILFETKRAYHWLADREELAVLRQFKQEQATQDNLTGLNTRNAFLKLLELQVIKAEVNKESIALAILDIDHFKNYNHEYGMLSGDACIRLISELVRNGTQHTNMKTCRYAGDEIAVLIPGMTAEQAQSIVEQLLKQVQNLAIEHKGSDLGGIVTLSAGVTSKAADEINSLDEFVQLADNAMYDAKDKGRNQVSIRY